jgi:hypothetical protein
MPHLKNKLKRTGDTHLPDLDLEPIDAEEVEMLVFVGADEDEPRVHADGWAPAAGDDPAAEPQGAKQAVAQKMQRLPAKSPWLAMGAALLLGWLAARTFRALQR